VNCKKPLGGLARSQKTQPNYLVGDPADSFEMRKRRLYSRALYVVADTVRQFSLDIPSHDAHYGDGRSPHRITSSSLPSSSLFRETTGSERLGAN
jgi:hypothetical protein